MKEGWKRWVFIPAAQVGAVLLGQLLAKYLTIVSALPEWLHAFIYSAALVALVTYAGRKWFSYRV